MSASVYPLGPVRAGGGAVVLYQGGAPDTAITWSTTHGAFTWTTDKTDRNGNATAYLSAAGVAADTDVVVTVDAYAS